MQRRLAMLESRRCGAKTRKGTPCRSPAMPNGRCRMHGGKSTGAPRGNKNALKHGSYTAESIVSTWAGGAFTCLKINSRQQGQYH